MKFTKYIYTTELFAYCSFLEYVELEVFDDIPYEDIESIFLFLLKA